MIPFHLIGPINQRINATGVHKIYPINLIHLQLCWRALDAAGILHSPYGLARCGTN